MVEFFEVKVIADDFDEFAGRLDAAIDNFQQSFTPELERWGSRLTEVAKAYPFPKRDLMRTIDHRPHPRGPMKERLRDFWKFEVKDANDGAVLETWNEHPRAKWILFPTGPHPISAPIPEGEPGAYPLRWFNYEGREITSWSVVHPGTPGQPVHSEALDSLENEFDQNIDDLINQLIREVGGL